MPKGIKGKVVRLRRVRVSQNIGNGFRRDEYSPRTIGPNQFLTIYLTTASTRAVISAGWTITEYSPAYATDSYPASKSVWILILHNPTSTSRTVYPYLISKRG